jgi:Glycosyl transferase family 2
VRTSDRPTFLAEALASVVAQNCSNLEVIVVNDGGPDIAGVLSRFDSLLTIRYIHHEKPRGRAGAANSGLATARGRYINFLDDDDRLYPDHVAKLVTYLEQTGQLVAYSDCEQGRYEWVDGAWRLVGERTPFMGIDYDWDRLHLANYLPIMSVMFRRSLLERVELMDESLEFLEDWDFWLRLGACTRFQRLPGITAEYRQFTGPQYSARQWQVAVFQKHRDYWCAENMHDLASRLLALTSRNGQLEDALERADSQRRQAETRRAETETRLAEAETRRAETETRLAEAEARCQGAEATLGLLQRSLPMRLSRRVRHHLPGSVVKLIRAWGHPGGLAGKASTSEALLGTLRQRLPEPTPSRLEIVGLASAAALAPAPGSLRAVLVAGEGDDHAGVDHSRALTTLHRGLARDGRLWWAGSSGGSRALRGALPEAGFVVVRRTVDGPSGAEILVARADRFMVRRYEAGDESQILKLFEVSFGARRSRERWAWAYEHGPHGRGPISEAFDAEGHLVAHYAGYPVRFYRSGPNSHDRLSALQIGDTMTARHVRHIGRGTTSLLGRTAGHFYARACEGHVAFNYGFNTATSQKFSLVFLGAKRVEPVAFAVRDARPSWPRPTLWERMRGEVRVSPVTKFDGSFDDLLRRARDSYSLLVERDARYLSWRYGTCPDSNYAIYHAHRRGQLVGWAVFRLMGDRLIWGDALVDPGCPRAAADLLERAVADHPMARTIEGWLPPRPAWWGATVKALGFEARPEPNDLALMINPFAWDPEDEFRRRLYYTKGDSDLF